MRIDLEVNGKTYTVKADPVRRLLDILRDDLSLTGTKEGCGEGECGACSVLMNGKLVNSCLVPAQVCQDSKIITVDGIHDTPQGQLLAKSFAAMHSAQCGFCTPGMVMASLNLLHENPNPDEEQIREGLSGNICRCTGYDMIVDGIQLAAKKAVEESIKW